MSNDRKARYRDISDGLLRQRRNLLVISLLMPIFFISGASVKQINLFGTVIVLQNPEVIKYSILILFSYFFLRYWQYYKEETYVQDMYREMKQYLYWLEHSYLKKKVREKAGFINSELLNICFADPRYSGGVRFAAIPENKDRVVFPFVRECEFYIYPDNRGYRNREDAVKEFHITLSNPEYSNWHPVLTSDEAGSAPSFYREYLRYNIVRFHIMRFIGACRYMLNESYFTDYQLPFVVAISSAVLTICAKFI